MKNRYAKRSRICEKKVRAIARYFATDLAASQTAELTWPRAFTLTCAADGGFTIDKGRSISPKLP